MLSSKELIVWNHCGFLPQPDEEERAFLERVALLEKEKSQNSSINMEAALLRCEELFDLKPDWITIEEKQKGLMPWQGAVLWIQKDARENTIPLIQLSPRLKTSWLGKWYPQEEVLAHECVHAVRLPLNSSRFEEIAAYQTSKNLFRRFLGPIIRRPFEVFIFLGAVVLGWIGLIWSSVSFFLWAPWILCLFGGIRLVLSQCTFKRCQAKLQLLLKNQNKALAMTIRLTDKEIDLFARVSPKEILSYIYRAEKEQLRWRMLSAAYAPILDRIK